MFVKIENKIGAKIERWGTPIEISEKKIVPICINTLGSDSEVISKADSLPSQKPWTNPSIVVLWNVCHEGLHLPH